MATACVAGLAMLWAVRDHRGNVVTGSAEQGDEERTKGDVKPELLVYRKKGAGSEHLRGYAVVRRGDTLQIRYVAAGKSFGIIASTDSRKSGSNFCASNVNHCVQSGSTDHSAAPSGRASAPCPTPTSLTIHRASSALSS